MKNIKFEFEFDRATIVCTLMRRPYGPGEYEVQIIVNNRLIKEIFEPVGLFDDEHKICANIYELWLNGAYDNNNWYK